MFEVFNPKRSDAYQTVIKPVLADSEHNMEAFLYSYLNHNVKLNFRLILKIDGGPDLKIPADKKSHQDTNLIS